MSESILGVVNLPAFIVGTIVVILLPGPNSLYVLSVAARRGVRTGYRAACGVFIGDAVLMLLAVLGVASLLKAYPALFIAFKFAGAGYLGWIGINMLVAAWRGRRAESPIDTKPQAVEADTRDPLLRALGISLLNPKAILFFMAFFIQFIDRGYAHPAASFALLSGIVQLCSFTYLTALIFSGARLAAAFRRRRKLSAALTGGAGTLFLGFGAKLATASVG